MVFDHKTSAQRTWQCKAGAQESCTWLHLAALVHLAALGQTHRTPCIPTLQHHRIQVQGSRAVPYLRQHASVSLPGDQLHRLWHIQQLNRSKAPPFANSSQHNLALSRCIERCGEHLRYCYQQQ